MSGHTKGPLEVVGNTLVRTVAGGIPVADTGADGFRGEAEVRANAVLFSAAPEMLAWLLRAPKFLSDCRCGSPSKCARCAFLRERVDLVEKATGGAR